MSLLPKVYWEVEHEMQGVPSLRSAMASHYCLGLSHSWLACNSSYVHRVSCHYVISLKERESKNEN
jgi:hypothetical protein